MRTNKTSFAVIVFFAAAIITFSKSSSLLKAFDSESLIQQSNTVLGKVTFESGEPIPAANVYIENTSIGTSTDMDGEFEINGITTERATLVVSFIGYRTHREVLDFSNNSKLEVNVTLIENALLVQEIVVTGVSNPKTKLESSVAITTLDAQEIEQRVVRNNADLLKAVPGLWVESTGGDGPANVWVRGFPQSGGYRFVGLMEDGLPIFQAGYNGLPSPDQFFKTDANIKNVEAIRGGSAPIVMQGAAGAVINYISHTGTNRFKGLGKITYSPIQSLGRVDINVGGPISNGLFYNFGGFARTDKGVYDYGYAPNKGGQFKGNIMKNFSSGFLKVYVKYINDKVNWNLPTPYLFQKDGDLEGVQGFDLKEDGSAVGDKDTEFSYLLPDGSRINGDLKDGFDTELLAGGFEFSYSFTDNFTLTNKFRIDGITHNNTSDIIIDVVPLDPSTPYFYRDGTQINNVANLNGNGLSLMSALIYSENEFDNIIDRLELTWQTERNSLTFGLEFFQYKSKTYTTNAIFSKEVKNAPRMLIAGDPSRPAITPAALFDPSGITKSNGEENNFSVYFNNEFEITERLRIDVGARLDYKSLEGENASKTGQSVFAGGAGFVFGPYIPFDDDQTDWAATAGLNYKLTNSMALFGRFSRGYNGKKLVDYTTEGADIDELKNLENRVIYQGEVGLKYGSSKFALFTSLLYAEVKNATGQIVIPTSTGTLLQQNVFLSTRTLSAEIEAQYKPIRSLLFKLTTTIQDPEYTDLNFVAREGTIVEGQHFDWSGNTAERVPTFMLDFTTVVTIKNFNAFASVRYYSDRWSTFANNVKIQGFTEVYAGAGYQITKNLNFNVNAANLFNTIALTEGNVRGDQFVDVDAINNTPRIGRRILPFSLFTSLTYTFGN